MKTAQMCKEIFEELGDRTGSFTYRGPSEKQRILRNAQSMSNHVHVYHVKMMENDGK